MPDPRHAGPENERVGTERNGRESFGELVGELTRNLSILIRGELALVRLEIRNTIAQLGVAFGMFVVAGLIAFCGYIFFLMMLHSLFVELLPRWLGELVVMAILLATAGGIAWMGMKRLEQWQVGGVDVTQAGSEAGPDLPAETKPRTEESSDVR
jgi:hypothetical protein